jgi:hypothetical protein
MTRQEARERFREWCIAWLPKANTDKEEYDSLEELQWYDMSVGFFLALGLKAEEALDLATEVRYHDHYFEDEG